MRGSRDGECEASKQLLEFRLQGVYTGFVGFIGSRVQGLGFRMKGFRAYRVCRLTIIMAFRVVGGFIGFIGLLGLLFGF